MGNSVRRLFGFRAARPGRAEAMKFFRPAIDDAEVDPGEANDPVAAVGLGDADGFALQRLADEDQVAAPLDGPVGAHPAHGVPGIVPGLVQASALEVVEEIDRIPGVMGVKVITHLAVIKSHGFRLRAADELRAKLDRRPGAASDEAGE